MRYLFIILSLFIYFSCNSNPYTESEPPYSLTIISPQEGDFVTKELIVIADASDNVGIDYIELFIGNPQLITTLKDYNSPYEFQITEILNNFNEGSEITLWIKASDVNGNYYIINIDPGSYDLRVDYIGYESVIIKNIYVSVNRTSSNTILLKHI